MTLPLDSQLNDSDLELLSAYIDSQLAADERAMLEERLRREPALRGALGELRATVGLLRELEPLKPPRSFALDAAAVSPRRTWSFPWMGLGSALVGLLCVVAFTAVIFRPGGTANAPSSMAAVTAAPAGGAAALAPQQEAAAPTAAPAAAPEELRNSSEEYSAAADAAATPEAQAPAAAALPQATAAAAEATAPAQPTAAPAAIAPPQETATAPPAGTTAPAAENPTDLPSTAGGQGATAQETALPFASAPPPAEPAVGTAAEPTATAGPLAETVATQPPALANEQPALPQSQPIATSGVASSDTVDLAAPPAAPTTQAPPPSSPFRLIGIIAGVLVALVLGGWAIRTFRRRR